jgi:excisionase family DNA binding protein
MPTTPDLLSTAEVATIYGCHVRTVHRMVARGQLTPAIKAPGKTGTLLFRRSDVLAAARAA